MSRGAFLFVFFCLLLMVAMVDPSWAPAAVLFAIACLLFVRTRR